MNGNLVLFVGKYLMVVGLQMKIITQWTKVTHAWSNDYPWNEVTLVRESFLLTSGIDPNN